MCRSVQRVSLLLLAAALLRSSPLLHAQSPDDNSGPVSTADVARPAELTNDSIVRMTHAGLEDALIVSTIRSQPGRYDVGVDQVIALRQAGVSAPVIEAMQAKVSGLRQHAADAHAGPVTSLPEGVDEIGVYYKDGAGEWQMLPVERVNFKSSGWIKHALSDGIIKQDTNGHLDGAHAHLALHPGEDFLIYAPAGTQGEEYDLLRLEQHSDEREFRTFTGGIFHSRTGSAKNEITVTPKRIAPRLYAFTMPEDIELGEYGVLPPASSNQQGISGTGKIFAFALTAGDAPRQPAPKASPASGAAAR